MRRDSDTLKKSRKIQFFYLNSLFDCVDFSKKEEYQSLLFYLTMTVRLTMVL